MADDVTDRLLDAARSAGALARRVAQAERRSAIPHMGLDATGTVTARTRADGRIEAVVVDAGWRSALADDELPTAVLDAVQAAVAARLTTFEAAFEAASVDIDRPGQPGLPELPPIPAPTVAGDELSTLLPLARASMSEIVRDLPSIVGARHPGRSRAGHVTAVVSGTGALVDVGYDPRWLRGARAIAVGLETTEAVHAAERMAAAHSVQRRVADSPLGELHARMAGAGRVPHDDPAGGRREER